MPLEIISIPVIAALVYWIINLLKYTLNNDEMFKRFIPITATILGATIGVVCFYSVPNIILTDNVLVALVICGASGLTATGTNQLFKQLDKNNSDIVSK